MAIAATMAAATATASDAQIKATFKTGVKILRTEKTAHAGTDLLVVKTKLATLTPSTPKGKLAKAYALQGFGMLIKALAWQAKAAQAAAAGNLDAASNDLDQESNYNGPGLRLVRQAGALLHVPATIR